MDCSSPPPLTDEQLSAVLDGDIDLAVQAHLERCPACASRLARARALEQHLTRTLWRWDCPTPKQLDEYDLGRLDRSEQGQAIAAHLGVCPACTQELAELRGFLAESPAPAPPRTEHRSLGRQLYELIAQIMPANPSFALRGEGGPVVATVEGLTVVLDLEPAGGGKQTLVGQLAAGQEQQRWTGALVEVHQQGSVVAWATLDANGGFRCSVPSDQATTLRISLPDGRSLVVPDVNFPG